MATIYDEGDGLAVRVEWDQLNRPTVLIDFTPGRTIGVKVNGRSCSPGRAPAPFSMDDDEQDAFDAEYEANRLRDMRGGFR